MLTVKQLSGMLNDANLFRARTNFADTEYAVPKYSWLKDDFSGWWAEHLASSGLGKWGLKWDCDDFAWKFFTDIRWSHYRSKGSMAESISVGVMYYMADARAEGGSGGGHAINVAVVGSPVGRNRLVFIEPQYVPKGNNPIITLSQNEIESAWFINF